MNLNQLPKFKIHVDLDRDFIEYVFERPLSEEESDQVNDYFTSNEPDMGLDWRDDQTVWIY